MVSSVNLRSELVHALAGLLGFSLDQMNLVQEDTATLIKTPTTAFRVSFLKTVSTGTGLSALQRLCSGKMDAAVPLLAALFMPPVGRRLCAQANVGWFDLSGNGNIVAPGLRIRVEGNANRFPVRGRPSSLFAPISSRLVRWFLLHPNQVFTQRQLVADTGMDKGFVSRLSKRLEHEAFIFRDEQGGFCLKNSALLLEAWREAYRFERHTILRGHIPARTGEEAQAHLAKALVAAGQPYACTGLGAAWLYTHFAAFRTVTIYLNSFPDQALLQALGFSEDSRGANLWMVIPNDNGVFHKTSVQNGICCVSPVQAYLDLKDQPERSVEAAEQLRQIYLSWSRNV